MCEDIQNREEELEEMKDRVSEGIARLDTDEKALVQALFYEEMSEKEYAQVLGMSQPAVHKRKMKVLAKLKKILTEE